MVASFWSQPRRFWTQVMWKTHVLTFHHFYCKKYRDLLQIKIFSSKNSCWISLMKSSEMGFFDFRSNQPLNVYGVSFFIIDMSVNSGDYIITALWKSLNILAFKDELIHLFHFLSDRLRLPIINSGNTDLTFTCHKVFLFQWISGRGSASLTLLNSE